MKHTVPILIAVGCLCLLAACGPSEEEQYILDAVNNAPEIQAKGGHIEDLVLGNSRDKEREKEREKADDKHKQKKRPERGNQDQRFEAEILDNDGKPIGKVRGFRVEGFGTRLGRIEWYGEKQE